MMNKLYSLITVLLVLTANLAISQSWTIYEANELPSAFAERPFQTSSGSYNAAENVIIVDPDDESNNLLQMDISTSTGTGQTQFYWRQNFTVAPAVDFTEITIVFKAKGNPLRAMGLDLDLHYNNVRSRVSLFNGTNLAQIRNGTGDNATLSVNVSDWNTYRFTMTATETRLYVNEETTPAMTFAPIAATSGNKHFRFGDGDGANDMGALIDWVIWDTSGAYSPTDFALPESLVPSENSWTIYNGDLHPVDEFVPAFSTSSTGGVYSFGTIVDPDDDSNNLLNMTTTDMDAGATNDNLQLRQTTGLDAATAMTVVFKAKGNDLARDLLFDVDFDFNNLRASVRILTDGSLSMAKGSADGEPGSVGVNTQEWNIYRYTRDDAGFALYVNEESTPVLTGTNESGTGAYFRFGDGWGSTSHTMNTDFDWVVWDLSGAYSPEELALPAELTRAPLGDWTVYEADVEPLSFNPAFVVTQQSASGISNTIVVDPDDEENNLLQMVTDAVANNNQWRQNTTAEDVTIVLKAKSADVAGKNLLFDLDIRNSTAGRYSLRILNDGTYSIASGGSGTGTLGHNASEWTIFRFTKSGQDFNVYLDEDPTPVFTATSTSTADAGNDYFRFGDGWGSGNINTLIDWVVWDITGAYSPSDTRLPDHLTGGEVIVVPSISTIGIPAALFQDLGYAASNTVESYTVGGSDLTGNITITPPANFEVSVNEADWFTNASPLVLAHTDGDVENTTVYVRLNASAEGEYSGDISHTSQDAEEKLVAVSGTTADLIPELSLTGTLNAFTQNVSSPSASQNYRVSGTNLKGSVTVTAPTNFQVSSDNETWGTEVVLEPTDRTITNVIVYARLAASALGDYSGNITHTATDAETVNQAVSGEVIPDPGITVTGSFTNFSSAIGSPSAAQTYTLSGSNLASGIAITLPTGYEISFTGNLWLNSLTLSPLNGNVATITLYVRLNATTVGPHNGNIVHASNGVESVNLAVNGTTSELTLSARPHAEIVNIYPNPSSSKMTFERKDVGRDGVVTLYSLSGNVVSNHVIKSGNATLELDIESLAKGLYLIEYQGEMTVRQKFMKN